MRAAQRVGHPGAASEDDVDEPLPLEELSQLHRRSADHWRSMGRPRARRMADSHERCSEADDGRTEAHDDDRQAECD